MQTDPQSDDPRRVKIKTVPARQDSVIWRFEDLQTNKIIRTRESLRLLRNEEGFPQPVRLGKRSIGWYRAEVMAWLRDRPRASAA